MTGEAARRKAGALFEEKAHLVIPIDVVEREGDEAEFLRALSIEHVVAFGFCLFQINRVSKETAAEPGEAMRHRIGAETGLAQRNGR